MPTQEQVDAQVQSLSNVGILIHLAHRRDMVDTENLQSTLFGIMREQYERELTNLARRVGCGQRTAHLREGPEMTDLNNVAREHAQSITRTYNGDLARQIESIRATTPTANRATYAARLRSWAAERAGWKNRQIAVMTEGLAIQKAKEDFLLNNDITGTAVAMPRRAAEEDCQLLVDGGEWPLSIVSRRPFPIHLNCVHSWRLLMDRVPRSECADLWLGG